VVTGLAMIIFSLRIRHVGHDCQSANTNNTLFVNGATLAGPRDRAGYVTLGAFSPVHPVLSSLGRYAYIVAATVITQTCRRFFVISRRGDAVSLPTLSGWEAQGIFRSASMRCRAFAC